jgi:hypothetical protein
VIAFDALIRILTFRFRDQLPPGWTIHGNARSGGFRLQIPGSRSEADFVIDLGWIVTSAEPARERLLAVTHHALSSLQTAVATTTTSPWPARDRADQLPEPHTAIAGDAVNPTLRLWYGPANAPVLELTPAPLLNQVLRAD